MQMPLHNGEAICRHPLLVIHIDFTGDIYVTAIFSAAIAGKINYCGKL